MLIIKCVKISHSEYVAESNHSHTPNETPVSATYHSPPSKAYSSRLASGSQLEAVKPLFSVSLCTYISIQQKISSNIKTSKTSKITSRLTPFLADYSYLIYIT